MKIIGLPDARTAGRGGRTGYQTAGKSDVGAGSRTVTEQRITEEFA